MFCSNKQKFKNVKIVTNACYWNLLLGKNGILVVELGGRARHKNYVSTIKSKEITSKNAYFCRDLAKLIISTFTLFEKIKF